MVFWCYILHCADGSYYTGHTDFLERRFGEHHAGGYCDYTSRRLPVRLAWRQEFPTRLEALEAERRIKPWSRRKKQALIAGDWKALSYWAKPPREKSTPSNPITPHLPAPSAPVASLPSAPTASLPSAHSASLPSARDASPPFAPSAVEGQACPQTASTTLGTNGVAGIRLTAPVSSEVRPEPFEAIERLGP